MKVLKFTWLSVSICALLVTLYLFDPVTARDADLIVTYAMLVLAFPTSLIVAGAIALFANTSTVLDAHYGRFAIVVVWLLFACGGYLQWFVAFPCVLRKLRAHRHTVGGA